MDRQTERGAECCRVSSIGGVNPSGNITSGKAKCEDREKTKEIRGIPERDRQTDRQRQRQIDGRTDRQRETTVRQR